VSTLAGNQAILLLGNHGVMMIGPSIGQALDELYYFERPCETYVKR
jgi:ribulose-5-phosphate 4-epimerase/fuculose-1-phosphate aldolase